MLVEYSVTLSSLSAGCCVDEAHPSTLCSVVSSIGGETGTETLVRDGEGDSGTQWTVCLMWKIIDMHKNIKAV